MNEHTFYQQGNFTDNAQILQDADGQLDINTHEKCCSEGFHNNYFADNFLGIYFKAFELFRIFIR